jgi:ABC-type bacteriocin/lantibiotic exporter with double-glycine peptidase domain
MAPDPMSKSPMTGHAPSPTGCATDPERLAKSETVLKLGILRKLVGVIGRFTPCPTLRDVRSIRHSRPAIHNSSHFRRLLSAMGSYKGSIATILLCSFALSTLGLATPRITQVILDRVVPKGDRVLLGTWMAALGLVMIFQVVLGIVRRLVLVDMSLAMDHVVLGEFCGHLLQLPLGFFRTRKTGDLVARFQDHVNVRHLLAGSLTRVIIDVLMVAVYVGVMFSYNARLALLVVSILAVLFAFTGMLTPVMKRSHRRMLEDSAAHEAQLVELITAIDLVKAHGIEDTMQYRWQTAFGRYLLSNSKTQRLRQILESGGTAIQFLSVLAVLWYGATLVIENVLTIGELVAFSMYASQAVAPILGLLTLWDEVQQARASLDRIEEIRKQSPEDADPSKLSLKLEGRIEFQNVSFGYSPGKTNRILRNYSLRIEPGECVAIVGKSGSGKTTLARILLGLYLPTEGHVLIDGINLQEMDLREYRDQIGVVLQETLLLSGTIRENIILGNSEQCDDKLMTAIRSAQLEEFLTLLREGLDTHIAELGSTLSGGQRQRMALARLHYGNSRILILDEPTSNLDQETEEKVIEGLRSFIKGRTAVILSHSPKAIRLASRVVTLEQGMKASE